MRLLLREDLTLYLARLIEYVSSDPWHHEQGHRLTPAHLERTLRVKTTTAVSTRVAGAVGHDNAVSGDELADTVTDTSARLVVLADPGAGKTWLTRRTARRAAERALADLASTADLDQIEIPLLLTCTAFLTAPGDARAAAISPAVDAVGDLGPHTGERLKRFLREREHGILLILDSLDETPPPLLWQRPVEHALIGGWRTMLTSRPSAWTGQWDTAPTWPPASPGHHGQVPVVTAELQDLAYPDDIEPFIRAWFTLEHGSSADTVIGHLHTNRAAREFSTIPLFLTFLCLIMDTPGGALPSTRSDLIDEVIARLLGADWRRADPVEPIAPLIDTLQGWAWTAAVDDPVNGLSAWADNITTDLIPIPGRERLDAVAVPTTRPSQGRDRHISRRFVHRVVREHLVATHVATLPTHAAHECLLAHWWFDDTWAEIIPTAIAKHHDREALLDTLISAITPDLPPRMREVVATQTTRTLLRVCIESQPSDWNQQTRSRLNDLRANHAAAVPGLVAQSAHWHESNSAVVNALITYLPNAGDRTVEVARALVDLDAADATRATAVTALTTYLPNAGDRAVEVAWALVDLATTEATRATAVTALTTHLPNATFWTVQVAWALVDLDPTEATRAAAVRALTVHLPNAGASTVEVVLALVDMDATAATLAATMTALTSHLPNAGHRTVHVVRALVDLDPTEATRATGVTALTTHLPNAMMATADPLEALVDLATTEATRAAVVTALTTHLPNAGHSTADVARVLVDLDPTEATRATAITALTTQLPNAGFRTARTARTLVDLNPTEATRATAITALTTHLLNAGFWTADEARALVDLDPTEATRATAVTALTTYLPNAGHSMADVARTLVDLDPTEATRATAITALTTYLPNAGDQTADVARTLRGCCAPSDWLARLQNSRRS